MMLSLIYLVLYFAVFCVTGVVLSLLALLFTREHKSATKIGVWITQLISLFFFIHYMTLANPMGIVLQ